MLDFMQALEKQAVAFYDNKRFGSYEALHTVHALNVEAITARLRPLYPHLKITVKCSGLRLRIIGDASAAQNNGYYCQFKLYPAQRWRARHCATLSVMDFAGAARLMPPYHVKVDSLTRD